MLADLSECYVKGAPSAFLRLMVLRPMAAAAGMPCLSSAMAPLCRCLIASHAFTLCSSGQSLAGGAGCSRARGETTCSVAGALASASVGHSQLQSMSGRRSRQTMAQEYADDVTEAPDAVMFVASLVAPEDEVLPIVAGGIARRDVEESAGVLLDHTNGTESRLSSDAASGFVNASNTTDGDASSDMASGPRLPPSVFSNVAFESVEGAILDLNSTSPDTAVGPQLLSRVSSNSTFAPDEGTEATTNGTSSDVASGGSRLPSGTSISTTPLSLQGAEAGPSSVGDSLVLLEESPVERGLGAAPRARQPLDLGSAQGIRLLIAVSLLTCLLFVTLCVVERRGYVRKASLAMVARPLPDAPGVDVMTYETAGMASWDVVTAYAVTIVGKSRSLWRKAWLLLLVVAGTAVCEALVEPGSSIWSPLQLSDAASALHICGAVLLAVFLASSVRRWYSRVGGLLDLMNVIRSMHLKLHALGVDQNRCDLACRYGVLSVWGLVYEMRRQALHGQSSEESEALRRMLAELESRPSALSRLLPNERRLLEGVDNFPGLMWVWVGSLLGRMAQDGEIPHMGSDAYGRLVGLVQEAQAGMLLVRDSATIQLHLAYMHVASVVVHLSNLLSAVSLGLALGACAGPAASHDRRRLEEAPQAAVVVLLLRCLLLPLAFLASLEVGISLDQPFTSEHGSLPVERFLRKLEGDLQDCSRLVAAPPSWQRPRFQGSADAELTEPLLSAAGML